MAEYIKCRNCESPDCKGCNLKRLETMLENGKFDFMMNENRCINTSADVEPVQEWISVDDRLPQYTDEYNVTVGVPSEFGYFEKVKTLRFERINGKEPRWVIPKNEIYNVIAWMELPKKYQPPKGE